MTAAPLKLLIIGGGVSGLTLAHSLASAPALLTGRVRRPVSIVVAERSARLGGWIESERVDGFLFEKGPHSLRVRGGAATLQLIEQLGLASQVIPSHPDANARYIWKHGVMHAMPSSLREIGKLFSSPLFAPLRSALWRERTVPRCTDPDESVYDFFTRRFNRETALTFADPMVCICSNILVCTA